MIRQTSLAAAIALGMGLVAAGQPVAHAADVSIAVSPAERSTWLVYFEEPGVASFRGFKAAGITPKSKAAMALKATSPAVTGARRLDVLAPESVAYRGYLADQRSARLADGAKRLGRELKPDFIYDLASNGVALSLNDAEATLLRDVPGVKRVVRDFKRKPQTDAGPRWIHADQIWGGAPDIANEGEGVVVGVIDSGINAGHPSFAASGAVDGYAHSNPRAGYLGLCAGSGGSCNNKLIGIYDFTTSGGDAEVNDGSDNTGHGSHVASTVGGNRINVNLSAAGSSVQRQISGVAPHTNIVSYKVCELEATCEGAWILAGIDQAIADQVDVINYSIGGGTNNPWSDGDSLAFLGARDAGIVPVTSAGNDGPGPSTVSSPANAPWMLSVANTTHGRVVANRLVDLSGGNTPPPNGGVLFGAGNTLGYGPADIVYSGDFGSSLCANGTIDAATNPWPTSAGQQPFDGQIVVCDRGTFARVDKSLHVGQAGGGGFVLVNSSLEGSQITADQHSIPGTHLDYWDGAALKQWLASGSGHRGRLEGGELIDAPESADFVNSSSSRGPTFWGSYLAPMIAAPGTNILAAYKSGNELASFTGTSMASPHIAGSVALLLGAHPDWTPSQAISALMTTARASGKIDKVTPATPWDQGSGIADLAGAVRAGLYFPMSRSDFMAANGGDTRAMNLPALVDESCFLSCSMSRTVTDMAGGGTWTASFDLPDGTVASVSPSTFTLADGASRTLDFSFNVSDANVSGDWVYGHLRLERSEDDGIADLQIPVAIKSEPGTLPDSIDIEADSESGYVDIELGGLVALPEARFASSVLNDAKKVSMDLNREPSRTDNYTGPFDKSILEFVTVAPSNINQLFSADLKSEDTGGLTLLIGSDDNRNGVPEESEELCAFQGFAHEKHCESPLAASAEESSLWVLVHNAQAGSVFVHDDVDLSIQVIDPSVSTGTELAITGPGHVDAGDSFPVRISWDAPDLLPGQSKLGYLLLGAKAGREGKTGKVPVNITRTGTTDAAAALVSGQPRKMKLAAGDAQERLFIDVPPNASRLEISTSGEGEVDLYAAWGGDFAAPDANTGIDVAPARGQAEGTSIHAGATENIDLQGSVLKSGRWFITPANDSGEQADFTLTATITAGSAPTLPEFGGYFNPERSGSGAFLYEAGSAWALIVYSYLDDGTPTWYLGADPQPSGNAGNWRVPLYRYAWDGAGASARQVGEAVISMLDTTRIGFTTTLDGEVASQTLVRVDPSSSVERR
ncbi:MAG: S8 family serine peptidase [Lysobacteraceae bacterium]